MRSCIRERTAEDSRPYQRSDTANLCLGRAGCPQPTVGQSENRNSQVMRSCIRERTAQDSHPYQRGDTANLCLGRAGCP